MVPLRSCIKIYFFSVGDKLKPEKLPCNFFHFDSAVCKGYLRFSSCSRELLSGGGWELTLDFWPRWGWGKALAFLHHLSGPGSSSPLSFDLASAEWDRAARHCENKLNQTLLNQLHNQIETIIYACRLQGDISSLWGLPAFSDVSFDLLEHLSDSNGRFMVRRVLIPCLSLEISTEKITHFLPRQPASLKAPLIVKMFLLGLGWSLKFVLLPCTGFCPGRLENPT